VARVEDVALGEGEAQIVSGRDRHGRSIATVHVVGPCVVLRREKWLQFALVRVRAGGR
jgi:hypothetical protein